MRFEGLLKSWNDERGFGFLEPLQGDEDIFVHIKAFQVRSTRPQIGQALSFEIEIGPEGRKRAKNVKRIRATSALRSRHRKSTAQRGGDTLIAIPLFMVLFVVIGVIWGLPLVIVAVSLGVYLGASLLTFFVYAHDKTAAQQNAQRIPENWLHFLALAGGWPGALSAQQLLRHKSRKAEFRRVFWATVILNVVALGLLCALFVQALSANP
jgi:uncharacterized membrane protein YsdA (DUF1294 family)/cold shock CspA family protein